MSKREDGLEILKSLGLPKQQQNERSILTLIALAGLKEDDEWTKVARPLLRIWDIMAWMRLNYGKDYAANSRETIRRQTIHQFEQARLVDRNSDDPKRQRIAATRSISLQRVLRRSFAASAGRISQRNAKHSSRVTPLSLPHTRVNGA